MSPVDSWLISLDELRLLSAGDKRKLLSTYRLSSDCLKVPLENPGEKLTAFRSVPLKLSRFPFLTGCLSVTNFDLDVLGNDWFPSNDASTDELRPSINFLSGCPVRILSSGEGNEGVPNDIFVKVRSGKYFDLK